MTIVDLTGLAVTTVRDFPAVAAITPRVRGGEFAGGDAPPAVVIVALGIGYAPGGGTRRLRLQEAMFSANAYGVTRIQAAQLANAVVEAVNLKRPWTDAAGRTVFMSLVESGGRIELDPTTHWPFATVIFSFVGNQQVVA